VAPTYCREKLFAATETTPILFRRFATSGVNEEFELAQLARTAVEKTMTTRWISAVMAL